MFSLHVITYNLVRLGNLLNAQVDDAGTIGCIEFFPAGGIPSAPSGKTAKIGCYEQLNLLNAPRTALAVSQESKTAALQAGFQQTPKD